MQWPTDDAGIVSLILANEGGLIDNPNDRGGITKYGITIDTLGSWRHKVCTPDDVKNLSVQEASQIYAAKYIITPGFDKLTDIKLRAAMVDYGVLFGPIRAVQSLQALLHQPQDGILGPQTISAASVGPDTTKSLINQLSCSRISAHADRVTKDHTQLVFLKGWLSRAMSYIE